MKTSTINTKAWTTGMKEARGKLKGKIPFLSYNILSDFLPAIILALFFLFSFIVLFLLNHYLASIASLALGASLLFLLLNKRSRTMPSWSAASSFVLAIFIIILALGALFLLSLVSGHFAWALGALFLFSLAVIFLLFAHSLGA